jgi:ABC-2 type transport system permease protein
MNAAMIWAILKRELKGYFTTPVAYVFIVIFLLLTAGFTWFLSGFWQVGQASMGAFFFWHPWLYLFLIPAIAMRLWAEERKSGTIELLFTLPITHGEAVIGKFLAAWIFAAIALVLTFPMWITVNYLGEPDNGVILASYIGSLLMAGAYLAIGSCISAITKNQVIAFVIAVVVCLVFVLFGMVGQMSSLQEILPESIINFITFSSFLVRFDAITRGVLDLRDLVYFLSLMGCFLFANVLVLDIKKAQ